jgi:hypothetical protein
LLAVTDDGEDEPPQVEQRLRLARVRVAEAMAAVSAGAGWGVYHAAYQEQLMTGC